jgi:hypothetical protein
MSPSASVGYARAVRRIVALFLFVVAQAACAVALAVSGCSVGGFPELPVGVDGGGGVGAFMPDGGADDADADMPTPPYDAGDAGPAPVLLGVTPTPETKSPAGPTASDELAADLTAVAAGVRSVVISRSFQEVVDNGLEDAAAKAAFYAKHKKRVLFNLAFVDRNRDARPAELASLPFDDEVVVAKMESAIDKVLGELGEHLSVLTFGRDVDVFIEAHADQGEAIAYLAARACDYARQSPSAPPGLRLGVAASFIGTAAKPDALLPLMAASDVVALSYVPGEDGAPPALTSEVATHLDQMIATAATLQKPIVLQAVGYPSGPEPQSSPEKQRLFYETFFAALHPRRAAFAWVNVHELHDRWPEACASYAEEQGEPQDGALASFTCSLGLFTAAGEEKPAWGEVLEGAATFASP